MKISIYLTLVILALFPLYSNALNRNEMALFEESTKKYFPLKYEGCDFWKGGAISQYIDKFPFNLGEVMLAGVAFYKCLPESRDEVFYGIKPIVTWRAFYGGILKWVMYGWKNTDGTPYVTEAERKWVDRIFETMNVSIRPRSIYYQGDEIYFKWNNGNMIISLNGKSMLNTKIPKEQFNRVKEIFLKSAFHEKALVQKLYPR